MNKQIEQAYWNGFATKCAELGVDAEKLAQTATNAPAATPRAVPDTYSSWKNTAPTSDPSYDLDRENNLRQNRALVAGTRTPNIGYHPIDNETDYDSYAELARSASNDRVNQLIGAYTSNPKSLLSASRGAASAMRDGIISPASVVHMGRGGAGNNIGRSVMRDSLNAEALYEYGDRRRSLTPENSFNNLQKEHGYGLPQINWIKQLINRGIITAQNNRRPATGTTVG